MFHSPAAILSSSIFSAICLTAFSATPEETIEQRIENIRTNQFNVGNELKKFRFINKDRQLELLNSWNNLATQIQNKSLTCKVSPGKLQGNLAYVYIDFFPDSPTIPTSSHIVCLYQKKGEWQISPSISSFANAELPYDLTLRKQMQALVSEAQDALPQHLDKIAQIQNTTIQEKINLIREEVAKLPSEDQLLKINEILNEAIAENNPLKFCAFIRSNEDKEQKNIPSPLDQLKILEKIDLKEIFLICDESNLFLINPNEVFQIKLNKEISSKDKLSTFFYSIANDNEQNLIPDENVDQILFPVIQRFQGLATKGKSFTAKEWQDKISETLARKEAISSIIFKYWDFKKNDLIPQIQDLFIFLSRTEISYQTLYNNANTLTKEIEPKLIISLISANIPGFQRTIKSQYTSFQFSETAPNTWKLNAMEVSPNAIVLGDNSKFKKEKCKELIEEFYKNSIKKNFSLVETLPSKLDPVSKPILSDNVLNKILTALKLWEWEKLAPQLVISDKSEKTLTKAQTELFFLKTQIQAVKKFHPIKTFKLNELSFALIELELSERSLKQYLMLSFAPSEMGWKLMPDSVVYIDKKPGRAMINKQTLEYVSSSYGKAIGDNIFNAISYAENLPEIQTALKK